MENNFKVLMSLGNYVDVTLLPKGIYTTSLPSIYHKDTTIESMIERGKAMKDMMGTQFLPESYFENLRKSELVDVVISDASAVKPDRDQLIKFAEWIFENSWTQRVADADGIKYFQAYTYPEKRKFLTINQLHDEYLQSSQEPKEKPDGWISVKDQLPELEQSILAYGKDGMRFCTFKTYSEKSPGYADGKRDKWFEYIENNTCFHYRTVTHWCIKPALPSPPTKKKEL